MRDFTDVILEPFGIHVQWRTDVENMRIVADFQVGKAGL